LLLLLGRRWQWHSTNSLWRQPRNASNIDEISAAINFHTTRRSRPMYGRCVCFRCRDLGDVDDTRTSHISNTRKFNIIPSLRWSPRVLGKSRRPRFNPWKSSKSSAVWHISIKDHKTRKFQTFSGLQLSPRSF